MPNWYVCEFGHQDKRGQPLKHRARRDCKLALVYDQKIADRAAAQPAADPSTETALSPTARDPEPASGARDVRAERPPSGGVRIVRSTAETIDRADARPAQAGEWEVDDKHVDMVSETALSALGNGIEELDRLLRLEPEDRFKLQALELKEAQRWGIRNVIRAPLSAGLKRMGIKTVEAAHRWIEGLSGVVALGMVGFRIVTHLVHAFRVSPAIKEWKEKGDTKRKAAAARAELEKRGGAPALAPPGGRPPAPPSFPPPADRSALGVAGG